MSHCHSEHTGGGGDGHGHGHDHDHDHSDEVTPASHNSLYAHIDHPRIYTLNETEAHAGRAVMEKTWEQRLEAAPVLASPEDDPQLLMHVPFTGQVKLHSVVLRAPPTGAAPRTLKLFKNRDDLDFAGVADVPVTQTLELPRGVEGNAEGEGVIEVGLKRALWTAVTSVTLFFEDNWAVAQEGEGEREEEEEEEVATEISYLGFRGDWLRVGGAPVGVLYESAANPADHKLVRGVDWKGGVGLGHHGQGGY